MKSNILLVSTLLAAVAALTLVPVGAIAAAGNVLLAIGILAVFAIDYGRALKPAGLPARVVAFSSGERLPPAWREAA